MHLFVTFYSLTSYILFWNLQITVLYISMQNAGKNRKNIATWKTILEFKFLLILVTYILFYFILCLCACVQQNVKLQRSIYVGCIFRQEMKIYKRKKNNKNHKNTIKILI